MELHFQGTEIQLGLAVECQNATLSVKRRLACEQLTYFSQVFSSIIKLLYSKSILYYIQIILPINSDTSYTIC